MKRLPLTEARISTGVNYMPPTSKQYKLQRFLDEKARNENTTGMFRLRPRPYSNGLELPPEQRVGLIYSWWVQSPRGGLVKIGPSPRSTKASYVWYEPTMRGIYTAILTITDPFQSPVFTATASFTMKFV